MYFLRRRYNQKPKQWGPISAVRSAIFDRLERIGIGSQKAIRIVPFWEQAGSSIHSYGLLDDLVMSRGSLISTGYTTPDNAWTTNVQSSASRALSYPFSCIYIGAAAPTTSETSDTLFNFVNPSFTYICQGLRVLDGSPDYYVLYSLRSGEPSIVSATATVNYNSSHVFVCNFDQSYRELFVDGISAGVSTTSINLYNVYQLNIGQSHANAFGAYTHCSFTFGFDIINSGISLINSAI